MKSKQVVFTEPGEWEIREVEIPSLAKDEVLVKVKNCGLCTWEREIFTGKEDVTFPFAGGHEIAAEVVDIGEEVTRVKPGDKAAVAKFYRCNECYECRRGFDNHCQTNFTSIPEGEVWGPGGFSEYLVAKSYEIFKIGDKVDLHYASLAEPLACVTRSIRRVDLETGDPVVIIGAGLMGILFLKALKLRGQKVVVVQRSDYRRELAADMGADMVIDPRKENWVDKVRDYTKGRGAQAIFYTAGGVEVINQSLKAASIGGNILIYAPLHVDYGKLNIDEIHYRELVVTGSIRQDKESFRQATELIGDGLIDVSDLNLEFRKYKNFDEAMEEANTSKKIHRILLSW